MAPVVRVRLGKKARAGPCAQCKGEIPEGEVYASAIRFYGQSQTGKTKMHTAKVHAACTVAFLLVDYTDWMCRDRKPRGRKEGSNVFEMSQEMLETRRHLIRTRARLLRLVLAANTKEQWPHQDYIRYTERIDHLRERIVETQMRLAECGGPPKRSMMRRGEAQRCLLEARLNV